MMLCHHCLLLCAETLSSWQEVIFWHWSMTIAPKVTKAKAKMPKIPLSAPRLIFQDHLMLCRSPGAEGEFYPHSGTTNMLFPASHCRRRSRVVVRKAQTQLLRKPGWWAGHCSCRMPTAQRAKNSMHCVLGLNTAASLFCLSLAISNNLQFHLRILPPKFLSGRDDLHKAVTLTQDVGSPLHI